MTNAKNQMKGNAIDLHSLFPLKVVTWSATKQPAPPSEPTTGGTEAGQQHKMGSGDSQALTPQTMHTIGKSQTDDRM